jgi:histidinol phosphatase-like PHP family hydrolase
VDGFEAHNSNPRHENFYEKVMELASEYKKPVIAGSDAHRPQDIALSGVMTRQEIRTVQDFLQAFYENELVLIKEDETV